MIYMSVIKQGLLKIQIEHLLYQQATKGYFTYTQPFHLKMHSTAVWPIWQRPHVFYFYFHTYYYYFTRILFSPSHSFHPVTQFWFAIFQIPGTKTWKKIVGIKTLCIFHLKMLSVDLQTFYVQIYLIVLMNQIIPQT